ncbi:MAG: tyrosine-protein phosphatase [Clostridiales bacterium]|nr:tyrosine-protein phosphatase [Clostridiales bacterium]
MITVKQTVCILLAVLSVLLLLSGCSSASKPFTVEIAKNKMSGNVISDTTFDELKATGIEIGDIITVKIADREYELPVGTSYTDVDVGKMICRFDTEDNEIALAINMGSFAQETGIGEKRKIEEDPGYEWDQFITEVSLVLKEKQGYLDEYKARNLERTNERADYAGLSDEHFANFRAVTVSGMGENVLYRSCSPIDPDLGRNGFVMQAMEKAGIRSVMNLGDSADGMNEFDAFPGSYYSGCSIISVEMGYDFASAEFGEKVRECVLFIIGNDGPYLVHCKEGKDRTGILCAIL